MKALEDVRSVLADKVAHFEKIVDRCQVLRVQEKARETVDIVEYRKLSDLVRVNTDLLRDAQLDLTKHEGKIRVGSAMVQDLCAQIETVTGTVSDAKIYQFRRPDEPAN